MIALTFVIAVGLQTSDVEFVIDGVKRKAKFVAPKTSDKAAPVVLVFHGHGGNMNYARRAFDIPTLWPEAIVVYPEGLPTKTLNDRQGTKNGWQIGVGDNGGRDLEFTDAILKKLHSDFKVDDRRIYAMGHSNGGRFTYVLWAARGEVFAAYSPAASPAGFLTLRMKPSSAFVIAGERDQIVSFESQKATIGSLERLLAVKKSDRASSGLMKSQFGPNGIELDTYIYPGGHAYPKEALPLVVDFFKRHPKN